MKVSINDLDYQGRGIARLDNVVTFINNALPNEEVELELLKKNKKFNEGVATTIIKANDNRTVPKCPYYNLCGGCDLMHMNYQYQLEFKKKKVRDTINKFAKIKTNIKEIIGSDEIFNYRNKITFHVENNLGFYQKRTNEFIKIDDCLISDFKLKKLIKEIQKLDLSNVSEVTIRTSKNVPETMLIIKTTKDFDTSKLKGFDSIYLNINDKYILKSGNKNIAEQMNELLFYISPSAFFQVNTNQAIKLYDKVKEYAALTGKENVLDLYCGTGTIGLYLAKQAKMVYGIEINEEAIKDANYNKQKNGIKNIEFYAMNANKFLSKIKSNIDVLIVDPPRSGLDDKTISSVITLNPKRIVYVSCDVATLARDLGILSGNYNILEITPVDMFPNTCHCETICVLEKIDK